MNRKLIFILIIAVLAGCRQNDSSLKRMAIARAGGTTLYYDEIPSEMMAGLSGADSSSFVQRYINNWAKRELMFQKAASNITPDIRNNIEKQLGETRRNLMIYEYQRQMMLQKMDTVISEDELASYYATNSNSLKLTSNIVKALFIKLPVETPDIARIRVLARSENQKDQQELESLCYQFAEKFDDFNEQWVTLDRLSLEIGEEIGDQENFLKRNTFYEKSDPSSVCFITFNDYRLRGSVAPFDYVRDDIKRIIWNGRRIDFIQNLEDGIYDEALKENSFKIY